MMRTDHELISKVSLHTDPLLDHAKPLISGTAMFKVFHLMTFEV